jgi:sec-independent protein translocase protein TatC
MTDETKKPGSSPEDELAGTEAPFVSHLVELRDRMIRAFIAIGIAFGILLAYPGMGGLYDLLAAPLTANLPPGTKLIATSVFSPFMVPLKITMVAALLLALPYVLYQVWAFVAPGLYSHEKRMVLPLVVSSTILFIAGVAFCYYIVIPALTRFIAGVTPASVSAAPDIEQYFGTVLTLFLVFGITFEVPVGVVVLARIGVVSIEQLRKWRGYFIVIAFIVAAIVTPPDVVSQLSLAIPMCILYEIGILAAQLFVRAAKKPPEKAPGPADASAATPAPVPEPAPATAATSTATATAPATATPPADSAAVPDPKGGSAT